LILVQWSCDVPQEKLESFLKFVEEKMKTSYKSHGCKRFELFMPMERKKRYFSYQITQKRNRYAEQAVFDDTPKTLRSFLKPWKKIL
jgi:quinol monooxygenase YgiN